VTAMQDYRVKAIKSLVKLGVKPECYLEELREHCRLYLSHGFSIIPVRLVIREYEAERDEGKRPLVPWSDYQRRRPTMEEVEGWIRRFGPFNIGIVCGSISNLCVLDVDDYAPLSGELPLESWSTPIVKTGKERGYHVYLKGHYGTVVICSNPDIRLKGEGSYVLAPPSIHPSGAQYRFVKPLELLESAAPVNYEQLLNRLRGILEAKKEAEKPRTVEAKPKPRRRLGITQINWSAIPPCVRKAIEIRRQTVHNHDVNVFLRDFFMFLTENDELVFRLFKLWTREGFDESETRYQIQHWWSKRYLPRNCEHMLQDLRDACRSCELKPRNPVVYYKFMSRPNVIPRPKEKVTEPVPPELEGYVNVKTFRKDQPLLIRRLVEAYNNGLDAVLNPPTGYGKTLVFVTAARLLGVPTAIITCDKGLQNQLREYGVLVLKGKDNYRCPRYNVKASLAPCSVKRRFNCDMWCEWREVVSAYERIMRSGGIVALNFGNWYRALRASYVIIDEFHETVARMCHPLRLHRYGEDDHENIALNLKAVERELESLQDEIEHLEPGSKEYLKMAVRIRDLQNMREKLGFYLENIDHVFSYHDKEGRYYVELDLIGTLMRLDRTIEARKLWVSASPVMFKEMPIITSDYRVADRTNAPIIFMPISRLTSRQVWERPDLLAVTGDFIALTFEWAKKAIGTRKAVIYTGNTTTHMAVADHLERRGYDVLRHEAGNLERVIREFKEGPHDFLCATAIESGYDFDEPEINLMFIVKVPYPDLSDPKWNGFKRRFGEDRFNEEYDRIAVNSILQACGRIARSEDKVSLTFILDEKFTDLYNRRKDWFTGDFKDRLIGEPF